MTTWVLLRGLTRESGHWGEFPGLLQARWPNARIVALDLPGNGSFNGQQSPSRIERMTQWCRDHLRASGLPPPYSVLALSMGGMVAVDWASRAPTELGACVLINTSLQPFSPWYRRLRPSTYATLFKIAITADVDQSHERAILRLTSHNAVASAAVLDDWTRLRKTRPTSTANALRQVLAAARYRAAQARPAVPLLVLTSRRDALVDWRCSQALARRWQLDLAVHPTAGHDLTLDDGPWVVEQMRLWMSARVSV